MGSIANSLNGLSYLTQPGGLLSSLPAPISTAVLQSASPQDVVNSQRSRSPERRK
jgi:hypothetical protein